MTFYIGQQHPITVYRTGLGVCVVLLLSVVRCSCHFFLYKMLFHHDFHQLCLSKTRKGLLSMQEHLACRSNYLLQPPKYLIIVVNLFRYINNNLTKDRCSIPMDMAVVLSPHKFSLQATIDHHGPSMYSGHYTASINCCKRTFYCNDSKSTEFEAIDTPNSSTADVVMYRLIT